MKDELILDLDYIEDSAAAVDMNVVMTGAGAFVEFQGTGEEATFTRDEMNGLVSLAEEGIHQLFEVQKEALGRCCAINRSERRRIIMKEVLIATNNAGKAKDFEALFKPFGVEVLTLNDIEGDIDVEETGDTFEENAILKAETVANASW